MMKLCLIKENFEDVPNSDVADINDQLKKRTPSYTMFGYTRYSQRIEHQEQPLHIIDQLAKDPLCSLNRDHKPIGC